MPLATDNSSSETTIAMNSVTDMALQAVDAARTINRVRMIAIAIGVSIVAVVAGIVVWQIVKAIQKKRHHHQPEPKQEKDDTDQ